nr:MAG TPA: hypothetical protein [Caudoviricetes sp.]
MRTDCLTENFGTECQRTSTGVLCRKCRHSTPGKV